MAPRHLRQHLAHPHPRLDSPPTPPPLPQSNHHLPHSFNHHSLPLDLHTAESISPPHILPPQPNHLASHQLPHPLPSPPQLLSQGTPPGNAESSADSVREPDASEPAEQPPSASRAAIATPADLPLYSNGRGSISSLPCDQVEELLRPCLTAAESRAAKLLQQTMDTVQSQILCALHQASLDIIEHLGKEAATRVVAAERKAAVLQQELFNVKQQAFSMLLRLKGDTDAQILEAENKYLFERKRAQDAEAKLSAVQDTSRRLKSELRKKGEILEKMQKLVQPDAEYLEKSSRLEETSERRRIGSKSKVNELHSKAQMPEVQNKMLCSMENVKDSRYTKNGFPPVLSNGMNIQKTLPTALKPGDEAAADQTAEMKLERRWESSTAETSSSGKVGLVGVRSQMRSLSAIRESSSACLDPKEGPGLLPEVAGASPVHNGQCERSDHHVLLRQSGQVNRSPSNAENHDKQVDEVHKAEVQKSTPCLEEIQKPIGPDVQRSPDLHGIRTGEDSYDVENTVVIEQRASSFHRSLCGEDEGILLKEQGECLLYECLSKSVGSERFRMQTFEAKGDSHDTSVGQIQVDGDSGIPEGGCQTLNFQKNVREYLIDQTTSRCNSGDLAATMELPCNLEACKKDEQDICFDSHKKDPESSVCMSEDHGLVMPSEVVRPDYEVATSLAELAVTAKEVEKSSLEALASDTGKQGNDNRPHKLGLRTKRKGASLEQKDSSVLPTKQRKRPRVSKGQAGLSDSHTERSSRRPRVGNSASSKDSLAVESSRDSRRLMQGARQLLCLSEKKWR